MIWPEQARLPAPKEKCCMPELDCSSGAVLGAREESSSQRSGLKTQPDGPKWSTSWLAA